MRFIQSQAVSFLLLMAASCFLPVAYANERLAQPDIDHAIELAQEQFQAQYGGLMLSRSNVEVSLNGHGDEVEVRIHYQWGGRKLARYFCGYEIPGRLCCDRVFSGPGAL